MCGLVFSGGGSGCGPATAWSWEPRAGPPGGQAASVCMHPPGQPGPHALDRGKSIKAPSTASSLFPGETVGPTWQESAWLGVKGWLNPGLGLHPPEFWAGPAHLSWQGKLEA